MDYPDIIKRPMDLGTVKENLNVGTYEYVEEVINDL